MAHRSLAILLLASSLAACASSASRSHDAHVVTDSGAHVDAASAPDAFAPSMDVGPTPIDAFAGTDAFVASDAGHDAAAASDAGHDAAAASDAGHDAAASGPCTLTHLVISEVRSRGAGGAGDEYVELYNPTGSAVALDSTWQLTVRSSSATTYSARWTGTGLMIPAHGHFLLAGTGYTQMPAADEALSSGITDAGSVVLSHASATVDAVCYAFSASTMAALDSTYTCEGTPVANPHDNSTATNADASIERRPGGSAGSCTDTGDSASDFATLMPGAPQDRTSPATP